MPHSNVIATRSGAVRNRPPVTLITLYARKEKSRDPIDAIYFKNRRDTVLYKDKKCTKFVARFPWHYSRCPRKNTKEITLDCFKWKLCWCN